MRGIHRWPVNFPHKGPSTRKKFPFDDVIMVTQWVNRFCCESDSLRKLHGVLNITGSVMTAMSSTWILDFVWTWWRHQMETFSALLALCAGNSPVPGEFPAQRPVTRSFDVFFDLRPNKRLSKQPWGWWFETLSWSLWRQCNDLFNRHDPG